MKDLAHLVSLIVKEGKIRHSAQDFNAARTEALRGLQDFVPQSETTDSRGWLRSENPFFRGVVAQAAFIKRSLQENGGHLHDPHTGLAYIRIPKAASTSLSLAMLQSKYPRLSRESLSSALINFLADVNLEVDPRKDRPAQFFTAVRDPFQRLLSVYRNFFETPGDDFLYEDYFFGVLKKNMSFRKFLRTISVIPDVLKDQHFRPQYLFLQPYHHRKIPVKIFRLEEKGLQEFLGSFNISVPRVNESSPTNDYRAYYDDEAGELASRIVAGDCRQFGYPARIRH